MKEINRAVPYPRILLAEDDSALRELLAFSLFRAGFSVTSCSNGLELLERLEPTPTPGEETYDLVLTDLRMPALTGLEVLETLHDLPRRPLFLCMTAFGDSATHAQARKLGATFTIDKPFDIDRLISLIDSLCPAEVQRKPHPRSAS
jgi:CheY-like chemotaxis protein